MAGRNRCGRGWAPGVLDRAAAKVEAGETVQTVASGMGKPRQTLAAALKAHKGADWWAQHVTRSGAGWSKAS